jgi:hypothetical protein
LVAANVMWAKRVILIVRRPLPVLPDERTFSESVGMSQRCQFRKSARLLDHFVGQRKQLRRNFKSECLGGLEVDNEFECC